MGNQGGMVNAIGNVVPYAPIGAVVTPMLAIRVGALVLGAFRHACVHKCQNKTVAPRKLSGPTHHKRRGRVSRRGICLQIFGGKHIGLARYSVVGRWWRKKGKPHLGAPPPSPQSVAAYRKRCQRVEGVTLRLAAKFDARPILATCVLLWWTVWRWKLRIFFKKNEGALFVFFKKNILSSCQWCALYCCQTTPGQTIIGILDS